MVRYNNKVGKRPYTKPNPQTLTLTTSTGCIATAKPAGSRSSLTSQGPRNGTRTGLTTQDRHHGCKLDSSSYIPISETLSTEPYLYTPPRSNISVEDARSARSSTLTFRNLRKSLLHFSILIARVLLQDSSSSTLFGSRSLTILKTASRSPSLMVPVFRCLTRTPAGCYMW